VNTLARRIRSLPGRQPALRAAAGTTPGPAVYVPHQVIIYPGLGAGMSPLSALIASDGAMIPATGPGQWDQLVAAGRIK
jgi:hypothetical protein